MKTQPLARNEDGTYEGAISSQGGLSADQKKAVRKVLCDASEPLMLGTIAARAQIAMNTPMAQQALSEFVTSYMVSTREAELILEGTNRKTGREIFRGFVGTDHLRNLVSKGLA